jgi:hypothetical protein
LEQFIRQQNIAIYRRLLSTQTDNDEARRQRLLQLLADEEARETYSWQRDPQGNVGGPASTTQTMKAAER